MFPETNHVPRKHRVAAILIIIIIIIIIIQWNVLGQTAASRYFRDWLRPHLQGFAGGFRETRLSGSP